MGSFTTENDDTNGSHEQGRHIQVLRSHAN
jgi:hypothetical protein